MINLKITGIKEILKDFPSDLGKKVLTRTCNRVGNSMKSHFSKILRKSYNIKKERLDASMDIKKATWSDLKYVITTKDKPPGLQHYDMQIKKGGVSVKVRKDRGRKVVKGEYGKGGFFLKPKKGGEGIFERNPNEKNRFGRDKLVRLYGPDIIGMMKQEGYKDFENIVNDKFEKEFTSQLKFALDKKLE